VLPGVLQSVDSIKMKLFFSSILIFISLLVFAQEQGKPIYHEVEPGNTLYGISVGYKVPVQVLREWNKMPNYSIKVGQKLIVGYEKPDGETSETSETKPKPPIAETKPAPVKQESVKSETTKPEPSVLEKKTQMINETIEDLGFNVTEVDTTEKLPDISTLFPKSSDTLLNNLIFCGGVDDDRPVGVSSVFFNNPLGKNYVYVFIEKDTIFNVRNFIVDFYKTDDAGVKTKISTTTYELKPKWKYTVFKHFIENPGLYEIAVFDTERKKLGDGQVRIVSK
jgi:LysM repeat protein